MGQGSKVQDARRIRAGAGAIVGAPSTCAVAGTVKNLIVVEDGVQLKEVKRGLHQLQEKGGS